MINNRTVMALIPARGGSKGLPGKNLAKLGGHSLVARAVKAAQESTYIDRVVLSSDADDIIAEARAAGAEAPFVRPAEISGDKISMASVMLHALSAITPAPDYFVLLQPTSPLRIAADIDTCIEACVRHGARACVSVVEVKKSPVLMYWREPDETLRPIVALDERPLRRQDFPPAYMINGAVYVGRVAEFIARPEFAPAGCVSIVMPPERSFDIDTAEDLVAAERALA